MNRVAAIRITEGPSSGVMGDAIGTSWCAGAFGGRTGRIITFICAAVLLAFGAAFIVGAAMILFRGG